MHADLSRSTFRPGRHYSAVLAQQGRVQLDADANEQAAIQLHQARTLAADLIGRHGGPRENAGFHIHFPGDNREIEDLEIHGGRYYVDGILCEADRPADGDAVPDEGDSADDDEEAPAGPTVWHYWDQPDAYRDPERPGDRLPTTYPYVMYLQVWERAVTAVEDPALREVALGATLVDTAARAKVVWQALPLPASQLDLDDPDGADPAEVRSAFDKWAREQASTARFAARAQRPEHADEDPCLVKPEARYRGPENQLYRVEIHQAGAADEATFKWSRENGSVVFPVEELDGTWVELASLGQDDKLDLDVGDLVEFGDTAYVSRLEPLPLLRVEELDLPGRRVRLSGEPDPRVGRRPELHPFLRRWDHREGVRRKGRTAALRGGAVKVEEGVWLPLEDGAEVYFEKGGRYRAGDYWTVAARTATGDVEWPVNAARKPLLARPAGIVRHYAPLALVKGEQEPVDLRLAFSALATRSIPHASEADLAAEARARDEEYAAENAAPSGMSRSETTAAAEAIVDEGGL
ncbi:DUF6519 domain-containing protein [Streptomyces cavernicola]|uniref:DUF6519 domain-containing protein n=1 Tax=Streptomyces cavernicola TaxID=3043613 RepID=A0ABT6S6C4_9ACTN|nr:DUF6519 domain-containing protein [Streptomyces sp. B-S-A6]MDI3403651.1 DUF6519 domain-containing protein [Streptomyces sp. B-S-A6]